MPEGQGGAGAVPGISSSAQTPVLRPSTSSTPGHPVLHNWSASSCLLSRHCHRTGETKAERGEVATKVPRGRQDFQPPLCPTSSQEATRARWEETQMDTSFPSSSIWEVAQQTSQGGMQVIPKPAQCCSPRITTHPYPVCPPALPSAPHLRIPTVCKPCVTSQLTCLHPWDLLKACPFLLIPHHHGQAPLSARVTQPRSLIPKPLSSGVS